MLVLKAHYWLKLLIAIPMALAIMTMGLHTPSKAMSSKANIESCQAHQDKDGDDDGHDRLHASPCCASLCPVALTIHSLDTFVDQPRIALPLLPVQHDGALSFDQSGPHRPPR